MYFTSMSHSQRFGKRIEEWVINNLREKGVACQEHFSWLDAYDFTINDGGLVVEVKAATVSYYRRSNGGKWRQRWGFNLARGCEMPDYYVLVAVVEGMLYPFIVPGRVLAGKRYVTLSSHPLLYRGKLARYLDAWEEILNRTEPIEVG